jgi:diaminopimelate epimerase
VIGSDGILYGTQVNDDIFFIQILNIDGSAAEIRGNGISIFARSMLNFGKVTTNKEFFIKTFKKIVTCNIVSENSIEFDMRYHYLKMIIFHISQVVYQHS